MSLKLTLITAESDANVDNGLVWFQIKLVTVEPKINVGKNTALFIS